MKHNKKQVLLIFICITEFSAPLRSKGGLCYTPGVVVRVCVSISVSMSGSVSVSVSVNVLVGVCGQVWSSSPTLCIKSSAERYKQSCINRQNPRLNNETHALLMQGKQTFNAVVPGPQK